MNAKKKLWFYKKIQSLLAAGLNIRAILVGLAEGSPRNSAKILDAVAALDRGENFHEALKYIFTLTSTEECLLQAAQSTGNVQSTIKSIVEYSEKNAKFKKEINSALLRPMITFTIAVGIFILVTTVVIPKISANLPMQTTPLFMVIMTTVGKFVPFLMFLVFCMLAFGTFMYYMKPVDYWRMVYRIPIIGPIKKHDAVFTFFLTVSLLCEGGITLASALQTVSNSMNGFFAETIDHCIYNLDKGESMRRAMEDTGIFPFYVIEIIDTAERTGDYAFYFREASVLAESDFQESKNTLLPIIEMAVLATVALVIITTLLSVLVPIQQLGQAVFTGKGA